MNRPLTPPEVAMLKKFTSSDMSFAGIVREVREDYEKRLHPKKELRYL